MSYDSNVGLYLTLRSTKSNSLHFIHEFHRSLFMKDWKVAVAGVKLPITANKEDGHVTLSCKMRYHYLDGNNEWKRRERDINVTAKYNDRTGSKLNELMGTCKDILVKENLDKKNIKIEYATDAGGNHAWYLRHGNSEVPRVSLNFNAAVCRLIFRGKIQNYYAVKAKMLSVEEEIALARVVAENEAKSRYNDLIRTGGELPADGWEHFMPSAITPRHTQETVDSQLIFSENNYQPIHKLFESPACLRVRVNCQQQNVDLLRNDASIILGQIIPYRKMCEEGSGYYEPRHLKYYDVVDGEFQRIRVDIVNEDGDDFGFFYDLDKDQYAEVELHFLPPADMFKQQRKIIVGYDEYEEAMRRYSEEDMEDEVEDDILPDWGLRMLNIPNINTVKQKSTLTEAAGFNKLGLNNDASKAAGFGN